MGRSASSEYERIFNLLVLFRWLSLTPPILLLILSPSHRTVQNLLVFLVALAITAVITAFAQPLNNSLAKNPWLLGIDLLLVMGLVLFSGLLSSPYHLYALSPLMAAAFFFQIPGALLATTILLILYVLSLLFYQATLSVSGQQWQTFFTTVIGVYLITVAIGYASYLLKQLQKTRDHLTRANQDLAVLHQLSTALQRSANVLEVQDQVLSAITTNLNFNRALLGLVDTDQPKISAWRCQIRGSSQPEWAEIESMSLKNQEDPVVLALQKNEMQRLPRFETTDGRTAIERFGIGDCLALPLVWGAQPIGIILVELSGKKGTAAHLNALEAIARQTAVSLGMMMTRRRRARDSAIAEERIRIALDLHDSISQSMFGLVYTLEACLNLLPEQPHIVKPELEWALQTAKDVRRRIRETISDMWPDELTAEQFENDLRIYAEDILQAANLNISFEIRGDFASLSPPARRGIYRICQEGLSNIVQHSGAAESRICVDVAEGRARFLLRDNGRGFDLDQIETPLSDREHFGLRGMQERAASLGGTCAVFSKPNEGTSLVIDIPANTQAHHETDKMNQDPTTGLAPH